MSLRRTPLLLLVLSFAVFAAEPQVVQPAAACKATPNEPRFLLSFVNVELQYLLQTTADAFCKPVVVVDWPKGKITYQGNGERLAGDQARKVLAQLFEQQGYQLEEQAKEVRLHLVKP